MCHSSNLSKDTQDNIAVIVNSKILTGELFTAYDVTNALNTPTFQARHSEVKPIVHDLFAENKMANYKRDLADVGGDVDAWVYHPASKSVSEHPAVKSKTRTAPSVPSSIPSSPIGRFSGSVSTPAAPSIVSATRRPIQQPDTVSTDKRHRVCVPADALRALGLTPASTAYVAIDATNGTLAITPTAPVINDNGNGIKVKTHKVDRRNNVRVRLDPLGITATNFKVTADNSQVVVSAN